MTIKPTVPYDELMDALRKDAPMWAAVNGLVWKIWLENKEEGLIAGVYYVKDQEAFNRFPKTGHALGMFDVVSAQTFDVIEEFSKVTRAPL